MEYSQINSLDNSRKALVSRAIRGSSNNELQETTRSEPAAVVHLSSITFNNRVEKHISDYYRGRGELSKNVSAELGDRENFTANSLDPKNSLRFGSYLGALTYGQRSRFIANLSSSTESTGRILTARG